MLPLWREGYTRAFLLEGKMTTIMTYHKPYGGIRTLPRWKVSPQFQVPFSKRRTTMPHKRIDLHKDESEVRNV